LSAAALLAADIEVVAAPPLAGVFVIAAGLGVVWSTDLPDASRPAKSAVAAGSTFCPEPAGCAKLEDWAGLEGGFGPEDEVGPAAGAGLPDWAGDPDDVPGRLPRLRAIRASFFQFETANSMRSARGCA
jgi:hypothetical protein